MLGVLLTFVGVLGAGASALSLKWFIGTEYLFAWWIMLILSIMVLVLGIAISIINFHNKLKDGSKNNVKI